MELKNQIARIFVIRAHNDKTQNTKNNSFCGHGLQIRNRCYEVIKKINFAS